MASRRKAIDDVVHGDSWDGPLTVVKCHNCGITGEVREKSVQIGGSGGLPMTFCATWLRPPSGWFVCGHTASGIVFRCPDCCTDPPKGEPKRDCQANRERQD
jgi:hypothetical protein